MGEDLEKRLKATLAAIQPVRKEMLSRARVRLDRLTKPKGSLGQLEEIAARYVGITEDMNPQIKTKSEISCN